MTETKYETIIYWDQQDEIFVVEVPELPGCKAHGRTKQEALQQAERAASLWVESAQADGRTLPEPRGKLIYA